MSPRSALAFIALVALGCRAPAPAAQARVERRTEAPRRATPAERVEVDWQGALLAGDAPGPALFRRSRPESRGFAWIAAGTAVSPRGAIQRGRVRVYVEGPLTVRGWMPVDRLDAVVLARGRVRGTPLYVVPGDRVRILEARGRTVRIEGEAHLAHPDLPRTPAFRGVFPLASLGADLVGRGAGPTRGTPIMLRSSALHAAPNGEIVWEIPALSSPLHATVLREDGEWLGVRIGVGPFLVGYVARGAIARGAQKKDAFGREVIDPWADEEAEGEDSVSVTDPWSRAHGSRDALPPLLARAAVRPVWRVRRGARVRVDRLTVAIFREPGYAVELGRNGADVMVLAAIDDTVTVQGLVRSDELEENEEGRSE